MKKTFGIMVVVSLVLELVVALAIIGRIDDVRMDPVVVNECVHAIADNYGDEEAYPDKLDYAVIDSKGEVLYKNSDDVATSVNEAVKHGDIMLDLVVEGDVVGKVIFNNSTDEQIEGYKKSLIIAIVCITILQVLLIGLYYYYLRRTIIRPFEKLNSFAARVAQGNLDTPLELDRKHIFGSFTEAFDMMRSELKKSRAAEKKAMDDKKEMVAKLSHDIKTPVASIKSTSELGFALAADEKTRERFNLINIKSDQITALVSNLFNSSINDITEIEVKPSEQPAIVIQELIKSADYLNKAGAFTVPDCRVYIDRLRLLQAFDNIFMNSYKYADTAISVEAYEESFDGASCLAIRISDEGPGVMEEELPLLKEKYKRGSNTYEKDGAGLGLYLTNYYIENMDGKLVLENLTPGFSVIVYLRQV
ncbi:MAG TPA: sensor histidine kinase [Eubacterium sp.]|nr:sensor histidine kinase [Eubacterium sp.]